MRGEQQLKRILALFLPLTGWRAPVALLRGPSRSSGRPVTLLAAGSERVTSYISQRFFAADPVVEPHGWAPVWKLPKVLEQLSLSADLTVVGLDRLSARLFSKEKYLVSPAWIASLMPVPEDLPNFARANPSLQRDMRSFKKNNFERVVSDRAEDFDAFYDRFYAPYISERHGALAHLRPRWSLRWQFTQGRILWVRRNGQIQAGDIIRVKGDTLHRVALGLLDGRLDLLQERVLVSLFVHAVLHAQEVGCTKIFLGGSRPSLHDGVFRYKRKWGAAICEYSDVNYEMLLRWNRTEGVAAFFSDNAVIHRDHDGFSALWAFPRHLPLTAETLRTEIHAIHALGLHRLRILLPSEPPSGFDCPADIQLINLNAVKDAGPGFLRQLD